MLLRKIKKGLYELQCSVCSKVYEKQTAPSRIARSTTHPCSEECAESIFRANTYRGGKKKFTRTVNQSVHQDNGETKVPLTQGLWVILDTSQWDLVKDHTWTASAHHNTFYAVARIVIDGNNSAIHAQVTITCRW